MLAQMSKPFKLVLILSLSLLLIATAIAAHHLFFTEIKIEIKEIGWIEEFTMTIPGLELDNKPCFLVVGTENAQVEEEKINIEKRDIKVGICTNSKILVPLRIKSQIKEHQNLFFVPEFEARIKGGEKTEEEDLRLRADFSLYLLTNNCPEDRERIQLKNNNNVLCDIISSRRPDIMSFRITETRKNILATKIQEMTNKHDYTLVLKVSPCLERMRNLSSFSIKIENIVPRLIIGQTLERGVYH